MTNLDFEHTYWSFLQTWKAAVEDPEKQIFSVSHYNVIDYILEYGKVNLYEKNLLTNIVNGLKEGEKGNIIGDLVNQIDPESVSKLVAIVGQSSFRDPRPFLDALGSLFNSLNSDKFITSTRELIKKSISASKGGDVAILIFNLVRILLQRYSTKYLKMLPEKTFTKAFLSPFKEIIIYNALTKNQIQHEISLVLNDLESLLVDQSRSFNTNSRNDFFELFHNNTFWLKDRDNILLIIKKMLRQSVINTDDRDAVVLEITRRVCYVFLREFLYEYTPAGNKAGELYNKNYFHNLSVLFVRLIYDCIDDRNIRCTNFQHTLISNSLSIFLHLLSKSLCQQLPSDRVGAQLEAFINNQKSSGQHIDSFDFSLSCFRFIESVAEDLLDHIIALLQTLQKTCFDNKSEFLELLFEDSVNDLSNSGTSSIPRTITLPKYYQMIDGLFDKLSLSITKWKVFFEIGELDLDGKSINANEVTLYDARKWHKGERFEWDIRADLVDEKGTKMRSCFREYAYGNFKSLVSNDLKKINFRRNSARAMIKVSAYDASMAASEARKLLNKSLNMMVYEFTNEARLKHHPQITRSNEVVSDDDKISHYEINSDPSDILKISQREQEILESYERPALISRGDRLYRALSWFNAAFWESDNYAKYVLYWIGFEQLLDLRSEATRESTKEKLVRIIPSITVTWRNDAHANYVIYSHLHEIIRALSSMSQITSKMEADTRFNDWKVKDFIILENLPLLKQLVNNTSIEQSVRMLESWINENKLGIEVRTAFLRKKSEFEIAYLYARRNTLIHEGLTLAGDLDYFVNLLRKLLTKVISVTLSFPSEQDWDSISKEYNRPFSASFNLDDPPPL